MPKKLLVVGGGIIGLEMATVYRALGSEVTVVEFMDQLIPGADADLIKPLAQRLGKRLKGIHLKTKVVEAKATKKGIEVSYEGDSIPDTTLFDRVLVSVGRSPNGGKIGADKAGVAVTERGFINVDTPDAHQRADTSSPSATWSVSRCWRTRPPTRPRSRPKSLPA